MIPLPSVAQRMRRGLCRCGAASDPAFWRAALISTLLMLVAISIQPASAQPDSTRRAILQEKGLSPTHTPRKALWRAFALPGWGQWYNRQYYKIPIVYAGLGGFTAAILTTNQRYIKYRHAALYKLSQERGNNEYPQFEDEYQSIRNQVGGEVSSSVLRQERDRFRRLRDLSVIGLGLYYGLTVLDAYVSAHLLTFDVGEDLSMRVWPAPGGITAAVRVGL